MSAPTKDTKDTKDKQDRPEGDMSVGSTSIALGGTQDADRARAPDAVKAPRDGTGSVGDGKRSAKRRETDSGTSSTSVGTGTGIGTGTGGSSEP